MNKHAVSGGERWDGRPASQAIRLSCDPTASTSIYRGKHSGRKYMQYTQSHIDRRLIKASRAIKKIKDNTSKCNTTYGSGDLL